jgi:heat shock protein HtpX
MGIYEQIESNRRKSIVLVIFFIFFISFLGYLIGLYYGSQELGMTITVFAGVIATIMVVYQFYNGDKFILKMSKVRKPTKREHAYLINTVESMAIAAGIPTPKIYVIEDTAPNAFATGRDPEHATVVFTTGILKKLNRLELEGVVAHELSHVKNFDTRYMMLIVVLVAIVTVIADMFWRMAFFGGGGGRRGGVFVIVIGLFLMILAPIIAQLVKFAASRRREYLADADGILLTRHPDGLANALAKMSKDPKPLGAANKGTAHLYIVNPLKNYKGWVNHMFSTHPPVELRIKKIREM